MLDSYLAELYGVRTKVLNQAVRRNLDRFPEDFMFQLTAGELANLTLALGPRVLPPAESEISLRSQFVTLDIDETGRGKHRKYLPYAFTEQGVAMLSSVLRSPRAIQVNIAIMRAFVRIREMWGFGVELVSRIEALERKDGEHDESFRAVFAAIEQLIQPPDPPRRAIGFPS